MSIVDGIGLLLAAGLFVYLVVALLYPERFQ
jgi:K+-transporting ATPase KdpF subunit